MANTAINFNLVSIFEFLNHCERIKLRMEMGKVTTTWAKSRKQTKATNGSSTQQENPAPIGGLQLALKQNVY